MAYIKKNLRKERYKASETARKEKEFRQKLTQERKKARNKSKKTKVGKERYDLLVNSAKKELEKQRAERRANCPLPIENEESENKTGGHYIFRSSMVKKNGVKIYAKDYGKKAFRIWVTDD